MKKKSQIYSSSNSFSRAEFKKKTQKTQKSTAKTNLCTKTQRPIIEITLLELCHGNTMQYTHNNNNNNKHVDSLKKKWKIYFCTKRRAKFPIVHNIMTKQNISDKIIIGQKFNHGQDLIYYGNYFPLSRDF